MTRNSALARWAARSRRHLLSLPPDFTAMAATSTSLKTHWNAYRPIQRASCSSKHIQLPAFPRCFKRRMIKFRANNTVDLIVWWRNRIFLWISITDRITSCDFRAARNIIWVKLITTTSKLLIQASNRIGWHLGRTNAFIWISRFLPTWRRSIVKASTAFVFVNLV